MGDGLGQRHAFRRQLASGLPERDRGLDEARFREVMGQYFGLSGLDVGETRLDRIGDLGVQPLPAALEQRVRKPHPAPGRA